MFCRFDPKIVHVFELYHLGHGRSPHILRFFSHSLFVKLSTTIYQSIQSWMMVMMSTMSLSRRPLLLPSSSPVHLKTHFGFPGPRSQNSVFVTSHPNRNPRRLLVAVPKSVQRGGELPVIPQKSGLERALNAAASLYPLYVTTGGVVACLNPSAFAWFVSRGPASYSLSLGFIMLAMGLSLELKDLIGLFLQRPLSILFGCVAQYTIMPAFGAIISKCIGLPPLLSVGLILLACCPGGTASNVVTLIARGDVSLSIVMTVCTTLGAVLLTPLLTKILAGAYVPVDAVQLSVSTLQVVVAPILVGSYLQSAFPASVKLVTPYAPLFAVLAASLLASSVFSENVVRFKSSVFGDSGGLLRGAQGSLIGDWGPLLLSVVLLHLAGFFVGYLAAAFARFREPQRRAISIEVGMQNSSLGVVLATSHFTSPLVALAPAMSAVIMNIMGGSLGFFWRYVDPSDGKKEPESQSK